MAPRIKPVIPRGPVFPKRPASRAAMNGAMRDVVSEGQRSAATYPPQSLTKTGYVRTNTLKRSWSSRVDNKGRLIVGTVGSNSNIAPYNQDVQGADPDRDAQFDRAGWLGVDDLRDSMEADLERRTQRAIDRTVDDL